MKKHPGVKTFVLLFVAVLTSPVLAQQKKKILVGSSPILERFSPSQIDAIDLLKSTARELRTESDPLMAGRLQARIALELWEVDCDFAQQVFRWSFESVRKPASGELSKSEQAVYLNRQALAIKEVLRQVGTKNSKMADTWLKELEENSSTATSQASDVNRTELFTQIALQLAPTASDQATRLGLAALSGNEISNTFPQLLFALSNVDRQSSDQLFRAAIGTMRRGNFTATSPLIALGNYLFSPNVQLHSSAKLSDAQLLANYYVDAAWQQTERPSGNLYGLLETRGLPIVSRYASDRVPELRGQMTRIASGLTPEQLQHTSLLRSVQQQQNTIATRNNYDIDEQIERAENEKDVQVRDALLNSIAHVLMRQDIEKARAVATKINDEGVRLLTEDDLTLVNIQQLLFARSYDEARKTTARFNNSLLRAKVLVQLAAQTYSEMKDAAQPLELLSEALAVVNKSPDTSSKTTVLLTMVEQYARFDSIRAFETLQLALTCLNRIKSEKPVQTSVATRPQPLRIKMYTVINGSEMTAETESSPDSIDFAQIGPLVSHDYLQSKLLANKIEHPIQRANFLIAVAGGILKNDKVNSRVMAASN